MAVLFRLGVVAHGGPVRAAAACLDAVAGWRGIRAAKRTRTTRVAVVRGLGPRVPIATGLRVVPKKMPKAGKRCRGSG
ncbi:hypothetical protein GCM10010168_42790 [Actinoplanes ianthinogenes]|uniref:Secreted protein n=1 Tax=Actinoplanes ianthinogenes TaxID=122358 RepID=A0ABM7LW34_9ACTN|nr:hypothetical protein Aiant_40680 [Actinoplanes ianthinogenes]GGR20293.1 hypothetical protein GCM10010168_42790 [Actinoplanes ianthinogenes]